MPNPSDFLGRGLQNLPSPGGGGLPDLAPTGDLWGIPGTYLIGADSAQAIFPGAVYYTLFPVATPITITAAVCAFAVGPEEDAEVRMGIYVAGPDAQPDGPPLWDSGSVAVTTGFGASKTVTDIGVPLETGYYLTAFMSSVGFTPRTVQVTGRFAGGVSFGGFDIIPIGRLFNAQDFGAFPSPGTDWAVASAGPNTPPFLLQWINA